MSAILTATANTILNRVAAEVGLEVVQDPFSSGDQNFIQMKYLLNTAGEELLQLHPWQSLVRQHTFTTQPLDSGDYDLPADYLYLLNQTQWDRTGSQALGGPLSPQEWQYLLGQSVAGASLTVAYRLSGNKLRLYPQPPAAGITVAYEYMSRNWVLDSGDGVTMKASCEAGADTPQLNATLLTRYVRCKYLEAKGFDTTKAQADLNQVYNLCTARDKSAPVLRIGGRATGGQGNVPDTGYGL